MPHHIRRLILHLLIAACVPGPVAGQVRPVTIAPPLCATCTVTMQRLVSLGDADGPGALGGGMYLVRRDSRGRFYAFNGESPHFLVFDASGRFVRQVGRRGQGPGEFEHVTTLAIGVNDTVFVFEARNRRLTVLAPDLEYVRSALLPFTSNFDVVSVGAELVINVDARARDGAQPLRVLAPNGRVVREFGSTTGAYVPNQVYGTRRAVTRAGPDGVWVAPLNRYAFERWDTAGRRTTAFERTPDWFRPYVSAPTNASVAPPPVFASLVESGDTLWTLIRVAGPNWRSTVTPISADGRFFRIDDESVYRDVMVEAIQMSQARVLASTRMPSLITGFLAPEIAFGPGEEPDGTPVVVIWRVGIVGGGSAVSARKWLPPTASVWSARRMRTR
jgi:hypothetical protein